MSDRAEHPEPVRLIALRRAARIHWTDNRDEVVAFARELDAAGAFTATTDVVSYFADPHDWTPEHKRWVRLERPNFSRCTRDEWDVILDVVCLSPEARDVLVEHVDCLPADAEQDVIDELLDAGLIESHAVAAESGVNAYEGTAAGYLLAETRR